MKSILNGAAAVGLLLTIVPSVLVASGQLEWQTHANLMTAGMIIWFVAATWVSNSPKQSGADQT